MTTDLKKFEQARRTNIANTIETWRGLRQFGIEELWRAVSWAKKPARGEKMLSKNQISNQLDKYENSVIEKRKNR